MSLATKKYYIKGGLQYTRDPNVTRKKMATGGALDDAKMYQKRDDLTFGLLSTADEGIMGYFKGGIAGIGGGDGFYYFDGTNFRKLGSGEGALVTCTAGAAILTSSQQNLLWGMSLLPITAAGAVTVGTATTTPILPDGYPGQHLMILNVGANAITLTDAASMANSNIRLISGTTLALPANRGLDFVFSSATGLFHQVGPLDATTS